MNTIYAISLITSLLEDEESYKLLKTLMHKQLNKRLDKLKEMKDNKSISNKMYELLSDRELNNYDMNSNYLWSLYYANTIKHNK